MLVYFLMFSLPLFFSFISSRCSKELKKIFLYSTGFIFIVIIGLRYNVGGDWGSYLYKFYYSYYRVSKDEYGYWLINYIGHYIGGIYLVNLFSASVIVVGIIKFCERQPLPFLALLVLVPYVIIVVAMGYTRQSVALGFELLALNAFLDGNTRKCGIYFILGALFHKTLLVFAVFFYVFMFVNIKSLTIKKRIIILLTLCVILSLSNYILPLDQINVFLEDYSASNMKSSGAMIRIIMNLIPASLFMLLRKKMFANLQEIRLYNMFSLVIFAGFAFMLSTGDTSSVDRILLYYSPLQAVVYSRVPLLGSSFEWRTITVLLISAVYLSALITFLNYSDHRVNWVPYHFALFA